MKSLACVAFVVSSVAFAQIPSAAGSASSGAQVASAMAQAQAMAMTNNAALLNATIMSQAAMMNASARASFMGQAMALQAQVSAHNAMAASMANMASMQHQQMMASQAAMMHTQMMNMNAIMRARTMGLESSQAMTRAVQLASLDQSKMMKGNAMLSALAAQAAAGGQKAAPPQQAAPPAAATDDAPVPAMPPMMIRPMFGNPLVVEKPKPSVKPGKVDAGTKVKLHSDTHYSALYYTTNGWTPTPLSAKYAGPLTINGTTHLQVIAMGPNMMRSELERMDYTVDGSAEPALEKAVTVPSDGVLRAGTPMRIVFGGKDISSETASVGDEIVLLTDEDVVMDGAVIAPKGTPVKAALVIADEKKGSAPGDLVFELRSMEVKGKRVPLYGGETMEGDKHDDAVIKVGMTAVGFVSADTSVK